MEELYRNEIDACNRSGFTRFVIYEKHCCIDFIDYRYNEPDLVRKASNAIDKIRAEFKKESERKIREKKENEEKKAAMQARADEYWPQYSALEGRVKALGGRLNPRESFPDRCWFVLPSLTKFDVYENITPYFAEPDYIRFYAHLLELEERQAQCIEKVKSHQQ